MFQNNKNIKMSMVLFFLSCTIFFSPYFFIQEVNAGNKKVDDCNLVMFYDQIKDADMKLANLQVAVQQGNTGDRGLEGQGFLLVNFPSVIIRERLGVIMDTLKTYGKICKNSEKRECKKVILRYLNNTVSETDIYLDHDIKTSQDLLQHKELKHSLQYIRNFIKILEDLQGSIRSLYLRGDAIEDVL